MKEKTKTKNLWLEQAIPSDCHLSAKLVPTFADRGCHVVRVIDLYSHISIGSNCR
jgi:hypothetical protein